MIDESEDNFFNFSMIEEKNNKNKKMYNDEKLKEIQSKYNNSFKEKENEASSSMVTDKTEIIELPNDINNKKKLIPNNNLIEIVN